MEIRNFNEAIAQIGTLTAKAKQLREMAALANEMANSMEAVGTFLNKFGNLLGVAGAATQPVVQQTKETTKYSWTDFVKRDLQTNGASAMNDIINRFLSSSERRKVSGMDDEFCATQIKAAVYYLIRNKYLEKQGTGKAVQLSPTKRLLDEKQQEV